MSEKLANVGNDGGGGNNGKENKLIDYNALFLNTLNGVSVHEMIYDENDNPVNYLFKEVNPAFGELTGLDPEKIIGKTVIDVIPGIEDSDFITTYGKVAQTGEPLRFEQYSEPLKKYYDIYVFSSKRDFFTTIFMDITDRKLLEIERENRNQELEILVEERTKELNDAHEELIRKERLAMVGELTAGVGHEIRNPVAGIANAVYFLQNVVSAEDGKIKKYLDIIDLEVNKINMILSDLLDFSRVRIPKMELIDLESEIKKIVDDISKPDNVKIKYSFDEVTKEITFDKLQFGQVINNLISNSANAMPDGGTILFNGYVQDSGTVLEVIDDGSGIPEENLKLIFEPLFTTNPRGHGLGLSLVRRYVEANKCSIEVESKLYVGTKFIIIFPD